MVFNRNKMRILKPDFWKEHFPIQLFYRLFNHFFPNFPNFTSYTSERTVHVNLTQNYPKLTNLRNSFLMLILLLLNIYLLLDYFKTVNIIFDATRLFYSSS